MRHPRDHPCSIINRDAMVIGERMFWNFGSLPMYSFLCCIAEAIFCDREDEAKIVPIYQLHEQND